MLYNTRALIIIICITIVVDTYVKDLRDNFQTEESMYPVLNNRALTDEDGTVTLILRMVRCTVSSS